MKKIVMLPIALCLMLSGCSSSKVAIKNNSDLIKGVWELSQIKLAENTFETFYKDAKPTLQFDLKKNTFSGYGSCNNFSGSVSVIGNKISFKDAKTAMTMMACQGRGEGIYLSTLNNIDSYSVSADGQLLCFYSGKVVLMRFEKV